MVSESMLMKQYSKVCNLGYRHHTEYDKFMEMVRDFTGHEDPIYECDKSTIIEDTLNGLGSVSFKEFFESVNKVENRER